MKINDFLNEEKTRLDPKCWTGKKIGNPKTKMKGGVRVNNCVPAESIEEEWSQKYKDSINCSNPKGFSQKAHCAGKAKNESVAEGTDIGAIQALTDEALTKYLKAFKTRYGAGDDSKAVKDAIIALKNEAKRRDSAGSVEGLAEGSLEEYGDTNKGQKMLGKVHQRAADRVTSKQADKDPAYARKAQQTQDRAWDRLAVKEQGVAEGFDGEYDDEAGMADNNLGTLRKAVDGIDELIQTGDNLPEWCQEKIAVAENMLVTVWNYMQGEQESEEDPEIAEMYEAMDQLAEEMATKKGVSVDLVWETFESMDDNILYETAAWRRKEGKSAKGGLNAKGVASYRRENPGSKLQMAVTTKPSKLKKGSKAAKRRKSFCARMSGVKGPMKKPNGKPTRKALALRKWNC